MNATFNPDSSGCWKRVQLVRKVEHFLGLFIGELELERQVVVHRFLVNAIAVLFQNHLDVIRLLPGKARE